MPEFKNAFADNLLCRRSKKHWTQKQLSQESGVSVAAISHYERKTCMPTLENIAKLAFALDCTPNDLCAFPEFK